MTNNRSNKNISTGPRIADGLQANGLQVAQYWSVFPTATPRKEGTTTEQEQSGQVMRSFFNALRANLIHNSNRSCCSQSYVTWNSINFTQRHTLRARHMPGAIVCIFGLYMVARMQVKLLRTVAPYMNTTSITPTTTKVFNRFHSLSFAVEYGSLVYSRV